MIKRLLTIFPLVLVLILPALAVQRGQGQGDYFPGIVEFASSWEDLRFSVTSTKQGQNSKPDVDYDNIGLLFPQNDTTEYVIFGIQMPHKWKQGTELRPHVHYIQDEAATPNFILEYRVYAIGGTAGGEWTTITTNAQLNEYTSGSIHQMLFWPTIDMTGETISTMLDVKMYRNDNVVTGDVLYKEFDIHYEIDSHGSDAVGTKSF